MKQDLKQLLLIDLCERLPYGVICKDDYIEYEGKLSQIGINYDMCVLSDEYGKTEWAYIPNCKPYLFPMSSMTEEQLFEVSQIIGIGWEINTSFISLITSEAIFKRLSFLELDALFQWLNAHHFDYRGLLGKGLAIDCTSLNIYIEYGNK